MMKSVLGAGFCCIVKKEVLYWSLYERKKAE